MDTRKFLFLKAVLGDDGARALAKAAERGPELEAALLPRTIMAWLGIAARHDFEGQIPGVENTYIQFRKAEERYSGSVAIGEEVYSFEKASVLHLGACMAVALGADHERVTAGLKDLDIQRLGKNIDTLAKARVAVAELRKRALGAEAPGPAHAPTAPDGPVAPTPPVPNQTSKGPMVGMTPTQPKPPKPGTPSLLPGAKTQTKSPALKVTKSQAEKKCPICSGTQFRSGRFSGCICFRELAKSVRVRILEDGYNLEFGPDWDRDSILTLVESLGTK